MRPTSLRPLALLVLFLPSLALAQDDTAFPLKAKRVLFIGDSITHAGGYIVYLEAELITRGIEPQPELINLGLPSETCSGLSEPDHPFPRPDIHERLDRALEKTKPDVVVACYGMNDGIYYPLGEQRFARYQAGVETIEKKVKAAGAKLVLMTPTVFDPSPTKPNPNMQPAGREEYSWKAPYKNYDDVLNKYADWIMSRVNSTDMLINIRKPLVAELKSKRVKDPGYVIAPDAIHINDAGHAVVARTIANAWGLKGELTAKKELVALVRKKHNLMHNAWLTHVGHKRPGMKEGLPLTEAKRKVAAISDAIRQSFSK